MAYKILTKNGIDNTNIDGARGEYFNSGMRDGIVQGALNEGLFTATASNIISLDTCELRIAGHRIVIDEPVYHTFTNAPSSDTRYAFVAQIVVDDNQNVDFSLFVQTANTPLIQNDLYKTITGAGTYQIEIGRFTLLTTLTIEEVVRTIDVITGGTGKGSGSTINIGTVTTQTLDSDVDAEVDVSERYEEDEGKEYLDFTFGIPKAEVNVDAELSTTSENAVQNKAITNAVIRRDVAQPLTAAEKQQAQKNITHTAWQDYAISGVQVGWYQVANLKTNGNYDIKIKQAYNYKLPEAIHLSISINNHLFTGSPFASITQLSGVKPASFALAKIRVRQGTDEGTTYLDVYNPDQLWNTTWVDITSDTQDVEVETNHPFEFIGTEDNPSGYKISSLDLVSGFNTSYLSANTATILGTVSNLNTISQPVNSTVTYSFNGGCANAPITDSGMVIQMQESTAFCTQLVIANDENASTWRRSYRDGTWTEWEKLSKLKSTTFTSIIDFYNFMQDNIDSVSEVIITPSANITGNQTNLNITSSESTFMSSSPTVMQADFEYRFNQFTKTSTNIQLEGRGFTSIVGENHIAAIVTSAGLFRFNWNTAVLTAANYAIIQAYAQGQYTNLTFKVYYFD